ncbi:MAG: LLM class flavin-dependent oxidoreductase [Chloroflexi bacterium]|nr:LLM class flavin-dependent oxidoreductase [Chloroflexota bacterium]
MVRFNTVVNHRGPADDPEAIAGILARARAAEAAGFDDLSYADNVVGDVFPALVLLAQATERVRLMTRIVGAFNRSPVLIASGAAWVDRLSGSRLTLGLGASLPQVTREVLAITFDRPAARMADTLRLVRALLGEPMPGIERQPDGSLRYHGAVLQVERARTDLLPRGRVPVLLAASGPRMLRVAGMLADGIILELSTPQFVRWAIAQARAGARASGRTLDHFEVLIQSPFLRRAPAGDLIAANREGLSFILRHAMRPQFQAQWQAAGLAEQAAWVTRTYQTAGTPAALQAVLDTMVPAMGVRCDDPATFFTWLTENRAAGVTTFAVPFDLERILGVRLEEARRAVADVRVGS